VYDFNNNNNNNNSVKALKARGKAFHENIWKIFEIRNCRKSGPWLHGSLYYAGVTVHQEFLVYTTFEWGNESVLHVYEKAGGGKEVDAGGLRHSSRGPPHDVVAYADSQQPLYNSRRFSSFAFILRYDTLSVL